MKKPSLVSYDFNALVCIWNRTTDEFSRIRIKSAVIDKILFYNNSMFYGFDMDRTMLRISAMNLMQHGIDNPNIEYKDSLSTDNIDASKYTLVLANPPFKGAIDPSITEKSLLAMTNKSKKTELLFLSLFLLIDKS